MSEFELVEQNQSSPESELSVQVSHLEGRYAQPVLQVWFGDESWDDRPTPEEIPGWEPLPTSTSAPLTWSADSLAICWNDRPLLKSLAAPTLARTTAEQLNGFLCRPGEELPDGKDRCVVWNCLLDSDTQLFGLGQRSGPLERTGLSATNWTTDTPTGHNRTTDPLYQAHPMLWGVTGDRWWAILLCHTSYSRFDLGQATPGVLEISALGRSLCLQVYVGDSPDRLLRSLRQTLRDPQPPPLWSLGFHQSRWGYKHSDEITTLVETFRQKDLPLDAVHLDIDHMDEYRTFSFSESRFCDVEQQIATWNSEGVQVVTIADPGLKFDYGSGYEPIKSGLEQNHFIKSSSGAPIVGHCWPDEALFPDFCRASAREWWAELASFYLNKGVSGLWIDMNEPAIFDRPFWTGKSEPLPMPLDTPWGEAFKPLDHLTLRNLYGSQMSKATELAWNNSPNRPWVLTRSSFTGGSHHAWSWMGDNTSWWEHLQLSFPQLSSMSLVNSGFVGVDIGGFFGHCHGELYSAWIEASVVYPFMRAHSALGTTEQHPWSFGPEVEAVAKTALGLRYRLLPYIYSSSIGYCEGDVPPLRPLFFDYPTHREFRYLEDQVMFGPHLMACPFLRRGENHRLVHLPEGEWYDFHTGQKLDSLQTLVIERQPGRIPLFAKAGAVVPTLCESVSCTRDSHAGGWELRHFPGHAEVESKLYWDSGDGWDFRDGDCLRVTLTNSQGKLSVTHRAVSDRFAGKQVTLLVAGPQGFEKGSVATIADFEAQ
jgi:alpha-glucosidase